MMKNQFLSDTARKTSLMLFSVFFSTTLFAAKPGLYLGGGVGESVGPEKVLISQKNFNHSTGGSITGQRAEIYDLSTHGEILYHAVAGYNFNPWLGLEFNYSYLSRQRLLAFAGLTNREGFSGSLWSHFFGVSAVGYIPLASACSADLFVKFGVGGLRSKFIFDDPHGFIFNNPGKYNVATTNFVLSYGAGAQYYFWSPFFAKVEWNRISRVNNNKIGNVSYNQFFLDLGYSFSFC